MQFEYTHHARRRAQQRHITDEEVQETLAKPEITHSDRDGNPIYIAHPGGRRIKVVVARGSNPYKIITVAD